MAQPEIQRFLDIHIHREQVPFEVVEVHEEKRYTRKLIRYAGSEGDEVRAFLFLPKKEVVGAVLVHHQHDGDRVIGKSEVAGLAGDPHQFFCPALAERGIMTLAPDSICFEDRRTNMKGQGLEPAPDPDDDIMQHFNEMCYRLLNGTTLMKKVIEDSSIALSLLSELNPAGPDRLGILGHSYGGNTVIFHSPFDERIKFSCSSGAVCSYREKFSTQTGIEMAETIPGFTARYDIEDLLRLIAPRHLLVLSADEDIYAMDAPAVCEAVEPAFAAANAADHLTQVRFKGAHALDGERFEVILGWFVEKFGKE